MDQRLDDESLTTPPVDEIVDALAREVGASPLLCVIQAYERLDPSALAEVRARFDWSALRIFIPDARGENHGILLGTRGWLPEAPRVGLPGFRTD